MAKVAIVVVPAGRQVNRENPISKQLMDDVHASVLASVVRTGMVNIPELAEQIRLRNIADNVALEDIAAQLMVQAQMASAAMEFDSTKVKQRLAAE